MRDMKAYIDEGMDENYSEKTKRKIIKIFVNMNFKQCNL